MTVLFEGELFADYFQIYLRDEAHERLPDVFSPEDLAARLTAAAHAVVVFTARNMSSQVKVVWREGRPALDLDAFQHVVEAGFEAPSGRLVLAGLMDYEPDAARLTVPAGALGVRASFSGLDTVSADGLEGEDRTLIELWTEARAPGLCVLKVWPLR